MKHKKVLPILLLTLLLSPFFALSAEKRFIGSKNSDKYHYVSCHSAKRIKPANRIYFESVRDAKERGYVACKICKPPKEESKNE